MQLQTTYVSVDGGTQVFKGQDPDRTGIMWVADHSQHCSDTDVMVVCYCGLSWCDQTKQYLSVTALRNVHQPKPSRL